MFGATYATLDEAWGTAPPAGQQATTPPFANPNPNPYKDQSFQRQVLNSAASVGIVPREPQVLDAGSVKAYLAALYTESGPVAVTSLLPANYLRAPPREPPAHTLASMPREYRGCTKGGLVESVQDILEDPETLLILLLAVFGIYMVGK